jgi:predicted metal-dependent phosphoesterase TrpH
VTAPEAGGRVDLHTHTTRSDGVLEPRALLESMRAAGMRVVAISDHDTMAGYREVRAAVAGADRDEGWPTVIPAIEINAVSEDLLGEYDLGRDGEELHILGYGLDPEDAGLAATLAAQRAARRERIRLTLERLADIGMPLDASELDLRGDDDSVGRPGVARLLVAAGHAASVDDAFGRLVGHGCPGYVPRRGIGPREAIAAIVSAGGLAVLAHAPSAPDRPAIIDRLVGWGLRGLEVHYRAFPVETVARMARFAEERGLLATGGSDYHGDTMTYAEARSGTHVPDAVAEALLRAIAR